MTGDERTLNGRAEGAGRASDRARSMQSAMNRVLHLSAGKVGFEDLLRRTLELILDQPWLGGESGGCIHLVDERSGGAVLVAQVGVPEGVRPAFQRLSPGECPCGEADDHEGLIFKICKGSPGRAPCGGLAPHGHYCVPVVAEDRRIGLLSLFVGRGHVPSPDVRRFFRSAADMLAGIAGRKRTEDSLRESEERFELAIRGTDAGIWDWDLRSNHVYYSPRWKSMLGYKEHEIADHFEQWEGRLHPDDRERALATVRDYLEGRSAEYELVHRLRHKDGSYRWIVARGAAVRDRQGRPYRMVGSHVDITERRLVEERLRHRDADLIAARTIQEHLMPRAPLRVPGLEVRGSSFAADLAHGDYFDYFTLADGAIVVVVADVSGHGVDSALLMASTHARLRILARLSLGLGEAMGQLNAGLAEETEPDRFVTLILLRIDPRRRSLDYANAGHPPGFILGRGGAIKATLGSLSLPLAVEPGTEFPVAGPFPVEPGDLILLFTDGIFEACSPEGRPFGIDRVLRVVRDRVDRPDKEILEALRAAIREFTGSVEMMDDVTVALVRVS